MEYNATGRPVVTIKGTEFINCGCECGRPVNGKSVFRQGHDAGMVSRVVTYTTGTKGNKNYDPALVPAWSQAISLENDIQEVIDENAKEVRVRFSDALATKYWNAAMNAWTKETKVGGSDGKVRSQAAEYRRAKKAAKKAAKLTGEQLDQVVAELNEEYATDAELGAMVEAADADPAMHEVIDAEGYVDYKTHPDEEAEEAVYESDLVAEARNVSGSVKIGRWTYDGLQTPDGATTTYLTKGGDWKIVPEHAVKSFQAYPNQD